MSYSLRFWIVVLLFVFAVILSFASPKIKYEGMDFLSKLKIPLTLTNWEGKEVSEELNINPGEGVFNFISDVIAYQYVNKEGKNLVFIILDAGNFHDPKVCFTYAGYKIKEMNDTKFNIASSPLKVHTIFTKKSGGDFLSFYWIVIDKNIAHEWIEQKLKQLYFSLFNKKRVGLMVRIDIPATEDDIGSAVAITEDFLDNLSKVLPQEESEYIFGKH
jgi:EpsI family protein